MKKLLSLLLVCLFLFSASACGNTATWSDAYAEVLSGAMAEFPQYRHACVYSLYDVDKNGAPELMVKVGTCEADFQYRLYDCPKGGGARMLGTLSGSHAALAGLQNGSALLLINGAQGYETVSRCTLADGAVSVEELFSGYVDEYHPFDYLPYYELDDPSGLSWTGDAPNGNDAVLSGITAS